MGVQKVNYSLDKDGKMVQSLDNPLGYVENWFIGTKADQVGGAAAANEAMISIEVPAGAVFVIMNIIASYYSSASLAGRLVVFQSTTAAVGGTDILLASIMFDPPVAAGPLGVAVSKFLKGEKAPIAIVDNKAGSSSVYLNVEIPQFVGLALVANAATQEYSCIINGVKYL